MTIRRAATEKKYLRWECDVCSTTCLHVGAAFSLLDEGQRIKNWEAKTSRIIKGLKSPLRSCFQAHLWRIDWMSYSRSWNLWTTGAWGPRFTFSLADSGAVATLASSLARLAASARA